MAHRKNLISTLHSAALAAAVAAMSLIGAPPALSQQPVQVAAQSNPFSALVGEKRERRERRSTRVTHQKYILASDDRAFLFESRGNDHRIRFLCGAEDNRLDCRLDPEGAAAEIYQLSATRGPRGDIIYKSVEGETLLRIASYGGATVYWPGDGRGSAASKSFGDEEPLALAPASIDTATRRAGSATAIISALTGAPIIFDIGNTSRSPTQDASVLADAIMVTAKGIKKVADDPTGARIIASRISEVRFRVADAPSINLFENVLTIYYQPSAEIAGRPSSFAIEKYLEETL